MNHLSTVTESQSFRKQICLNTPQSLLDQWGKIEILPKIGGAVKMAVCQYYNVVKGTLDPLIAKHREELRGLGYKTLSLKEFRDLSKTSHIPRARLIAIFPPPAILCVGLLLRDSMVAKNLRSDVWKYLQNRGINLIDEEVLMESRSLRDELCLDQNLCLLDRVGTLATIDDMAWSTVEQVADFYRVGYEAIKTVVKRNNKELKGEGYRVLSKKELEKVHFEPFIYTTTSRLAIFPRRAILRVGMLLRDSEIAKAVRSYLLNAESQAPWRKKKALPAEHTSSAPQAPGTGISKEEIIELINAGQEEILRAFEQERKDQKATIKNEVHSIREWIWKRLEKQENQLDFLKRDLKGVRQNVQGFTFGILGDFEDLKGQKSWENKE